MDQIRTNPRETIFVQGRYRRQGSARDVPVVELSSEGTRIFDRFSLLRAGDEITLRIEKLGPFACTVRWVKNNYVGIQFDKPLYGPTFTHICETLSANTTDD